MKLDSISLYVAKSLIIGIGDEVTNCGIGGSPGLDAVVWVPKETVDSGNYKIDGNTISITADERDYQFVYRGVKEVID